MAASLLVSPSTAAKWGFTVPASALLRASARIRGHLGQEITAGTSSIAARGPVFRLPQRPVVAVSSVTDLDGKPVAWSLVGSVLTVDSIGVVMVAYSHGYDDLPDPLVELVCQVATRLGASPDTALAAGVQTQTAGPFAVGYGWDAWKAQAGLTQGEKDTLKRYWPTLPQIITSGPAA